MPDPELDDKLRAFLDDQEEGRRRGLTMEKFHGAIATITEALTTHEKHDQEFHSLVMKQHASLGHRLEHVESDVANLKIRVGSPSTRPPSLPPMRPELDSGVDIAASTEEIRQAVSHGVQRLAAETPGPGIGSTEQVVELVDEVVAREMKALEERRAQRRKDEELAAYQAAETEARAEETRRTEAANVEKGLAKQRRLNTIAGIVGGLILFVLQGAFLLMWAGAKHDVGVAEGRAWAPVLVYSALPPATSPATFLVTVPSASASASSTAVPPHR